MGEKEPQWLTAVGMGIVVAIILSFVLTITGQWRWFSDSAAASWVQAIVSAIAIAAGAIAVVWQVRRQNLALELAARGEEVRKLRILGAAIFHCRVSIERMQAMPAYPIKAEMADLRSQLDALREIPVLDFPDWRALHGVAGAAGTLTAHHDRIMSADARSTLQGVRDREKYLNVVLFALEFAEELTQDALRDRGADLDAISSTTDDKTVYSRSYPVKRPKF